MVNRCLFLKQYLPKVPRWGQDQYLERELKKFSFLTFELIQGCKNLYLLAPEGGRGLSLFALLYYPKGDNTESHQYALKGGCYYGTVIRQQWYPYPLCLGLALVFSKTCLSADLTALRRQIDYNVNSLLESIFSWFCFGKLLLNIVDYDINDDTTSNFWRDDYPCHQLKQPSQVYYCTQWYLRTFAQPCQYQPIPIWLFILANSSIS